MAILVQLLHDGALLAGISALAYTLLINITALTAILARSPARRRAALDVLKLLLRRRAHGVTLSSTVDTRTKPD
jgi:hypothetical protein